MAINRLATKKKSGRSFRTEPVYQIGAAHEGMEVSLCDEGMCFASPVQHQVGAVLIVDFEPDGAECDISLRCEAVVVDCKRSACGRSYEITVLFTEN